jgi:hypothetical protein
MCKLVYIVIESVNLWYFYRKHTNSTISQISIIILSINEFLIISKVHFSKTKLGF